ncbi:MAG: hypothetical protein BGO41_04435 [Clostridiales bacterium 38-18]|nr:MAG: hypothetical protein BGO41_04435 [Clostridiales bacterium 38-18]
MTAPVSKNNRIIELDIIRGFALFGVLLVNLTMIDATLYTDVASSLSHSFSMSLWLIETLAVGKFYTLFSILFGIGFYYFVFKGSTAPDASTLLQNTQLFKRRLVLLLFMGILHLIFVWYGDILHVYAITGFFLIGKRDNKARTLIQTGLLWWLCSVVIFAFLSSMPSASNESVAKAALVAYQSSSYLEMLLYRVTHELPLILTNLAIVPVRIYGLFLLGYGIAKSGLLSHLERHLTVIKKLCLVFGLLFIGVSIGENLFSNAFVQSLFKELSTLIGATFYASSLILLDQTRWTRKIIRPLAGLGQMAVTNYLMQTICFTFIYYGYGLAMFQKFEPANYWYFAFGFILIQLLLSNVWLKYHRFGPVEWVWRRLTYRQNPKEA